MIYDIHTHNMQHQGCGILMEQARQHGIDRFLLLGDVLRYGEFPTAEEVSEINDDTIACVKECNGMADGFCFMNPALPPEFIRSEVARCLQAGLKGVKLEISVCCRKPVMDTLMQELEKYDVPLLHHCWFKTVNKYAEESDPVDISILAKRFPRVRIVMAHLCGCGYRGVEYIADCPNVYVDTSGGQPENGFLQYAVKRIGADRLLYGSDAPCRDFGCQVGKVLDGGLSAGDLDKILYKNALELLKI